MSNNINIEVELSTIRENMFNDRLLDCILLAYEQEMESAGCSAIMEDYLEGKTALEPFMSPELLVQALKIKELCRDNMKYAMEFAFLQGSHAFFRQLFSQEAMERPFHQLVVNSIMTMPGMTEHQPYYSRRQEVNRLWDSLAAQLPQDCRENLTAVECYWDEQLYGVLRHSFYLGFLQAMESVQAPGNSGSSGSCSEILSRVEYELDMTPRY